MPGRTQGESFVLKHRLAGAAVLIGFAVIVLPMLLGGPREDDGATDNADTGKPDTRVFRSNITPIGGETPSTEAREGGDLERTVGDLLNRDAPPPVDGAPAAESPAAGADDGGGQATTEASREDETAAGEPQVAARDEGAGEAQPAASPDAETPREIERGWVVQVGTFTKPANVDRLVAKLEQGGFAPSTSDVKTSEGSATRVWVGPFETRVEAARMKTRLTQQTGSEALIVAYP